MERNNYILLFGNIDEFIIMDNATIEEVKKECLDKDKYDNYGREGVTAYSLTEPIFKVNENGKILINNIS